MNIFKVKGLKWTLKLTYEIKNDIKHIFKIIINRKIFMVDTNIFINEKKMYN